MLFFLAIIISIISITNSFDLHLEDLSLSVEDFVNQKLYPKFKVFSFFSSKTDNQIIYHRKNHTTKRSKESCVFMQHQEEFMSHNSLILRSGYNSCIAQCPGFMYSPTQASLAMRNMIQIKGNLTNATIFIFNDKSIHYKSGSPLIIIIDGCYFLDSFGREIYISWFLTNKPYQFKKPNVFSDIDERYYGKFTTDKVKFNVFNSCCDYLILAQQNQCGLDNLINEKQKGMKTREMTNKGETSIFIYFFLILLAVIFFAIIFNLIKEKYKVYKITMVTPIKEDNNRGSIELERNI